MRRLALLTFLLLLTTGLVLVHAQVPQYTAQGSVNVAPTAAKLTAVDPMVYAVNTDVMPARPFLYTVDKNGITITRFNDNQIVGTWPWPKAPDVIYTVTPDGAFTGLTPPAEWEPVAMTVSYPTLTDFANRGMTGTTVLKPIPDLTPPFTYVYVVMAHSGYEWKSIGGSYRDTIVPSTSLDTDSSMLIQIDVSDPSFSAAADPANPVTPHMAAALLGHGAGQPVYNRATGTVYVGNMPSNSLPAGLSSFVSVIRRIPDTVAEVEAEVPGISIPVIRCGPQHPESGIPVGRPQAFACYDPSGVHPINDNEHVGASGDFEWEFRNLPDWLKAHVDKGTGKLDGILYGTPPATGEWFAEARVHNLDDPYGVFSFWTPVQLLVTPTAEYLPVRVEFAAGVPVAYPLEGKGSCSPSGAPNWVDIVQVLNGCIVMGRAPLDGEYYHFTMPGFTLTSYPTLSLVFSGNVFGEYGFDPLPEGVGLSGMAWHQVSKVADPSTETPVLSLEYIGVQPSTGQLYHILPPPGRPQPPNERPPETALTLDVVSAMGSPLGTELFAGHTVGFGQVAVEADGDIFVATTTDTADGALVKISGNTRSVISLTGLQPAFLDLDSDLRTAIPNVEPGQVDHGALFVTGITSSNVAVVDTTAGTVSQMLSVAAEGGLGSASVDFGTRFAYVGGGSTQTVAILAPEGGTRPLMAPRIWSAEEFTWIINQAGEVKMMATGDAVPALSLIGTMPPGLNFVYNGDGTATISGTPTAVGGGGDPGGELDVEGGDFAMALTAESADGIYAQAFGITVQSPPTITSPNTATFIAGSANSFTVTGIGWPTPIFYIWDDTLLPPGVLLIDNENGTSSLVGTPQAEGTFTFTIYATTGAPPDAQQVFTLTVLAAGSRAPEITSPNTFTLEAAGAPYSPDPFTVTSIGSPTPALSITAGTLPPGMTFIDNGDSTATFGGACRIPFPGWPAECLGFLPANAEGTWIFTITATNSAGSTNQVFTLIVEPDTTILGATPATLPLATDGTFVATAPVSLTTGGDTLPYALVTTATWLKVAPVSGMINGTAGTPITVSADATGLAPGTYTGTIIVNSAGTEGPPAAVAVTLTVLGVANPGMVGIWPNMLRFDYHVGDPVPAPQMVWVMSGGQTLPFMVSTSGAKWLSAPASGVAPSGFPVSVDPKVGVGMHIANLTIADSDDANNAKIVPVNLVKTAGDSTLIEVMFDVGAGPEGLALNPSTHNLFITSSNAQAEANEAGAETGAETEVPGPPEPSAVFHIDPVNKAVVGETIVHSEGEYIGVNSKTGLAYHASQGTGEVAVIDGTTNKVVTFIPLSFKDAKGLEDGAYMPYQIAIDEAQNFVYVGTKAPEPELNDPNPLTTTPYGCKAIRELPSDEAPAGQEELDCWTAGPVFLIDGKTNQLVLDKDGNPVFFLAGDDPEGVVFAAKTGKVYTSNEDDGTITVAQGAKRNKNGSITAPTVLGTIINGALVKGSGWTPTCDANNYCGQRGDKNNQSLWGTTYLSACYGIDDEAQEADKMAVDGSGNVYVIDDRYRVAKINGSTDKVDKVLPIPGYDCERTIPDGSTEVLRNTANNIAMMAKSSGSKLYVTSEQNTLSIIDPGTMTIKATITVPKAAELDAITTDPGLNQVYITDEGQPSLWILKGACANGTGQCVVKEQ